MGESKLARLEEMPMSLTLAQPRKRVGLIGRATSGTGGLSDLGGPVRAPANSQKIRKIATIDITGQR